MSDQFLPDQVGENLLNPPLLSPEQEELCRRLDELYKTSNLEESPSDMFRGAIFAARVELRSNPDWMAQSAHSLREILYQFKKKKKKAFERFGSVTTDEAEFNETLRVYGLMTAVAHHKLKLSETEFQRLFAQYQSVLRGALTRQTDIHAEIDKFFAEQTTAKGTHV
jgi:hypothetical protein